MMPAKFPLIFRAGLLVAALAIPAAATAQQAPADNDDAALAYAQCMRDNGYTEFPDPTPEGGIRFQITPDSAPRFHKAGAACQHLAPEGMRDEDMSPEQLEALVRFSQCVRDNGVPEFPDPGPKGNYDLSSAGIGPGDARVEAAMAACRQEAGPGGFRITIGG